ncbi:MAG: glycosyltransferase family 4 protein [Anaerolineales bacterium]|nr:glycosyltransferase family 4 protein [Anaerolineales bacterium]MCX7608659.1 glycosyltransferase family 4 protein [Anaerolineales bacterium]MDW8226223.1 glycosyltransferase family 4 protein [Anaerolineales bacterium]
MPRICLVPQLSGTGGPASFQAKLSAGLAQHDIQTCYDLNDVPYDAVLVIGGTRRLWPLWQARRRGIRVVHRLDGLNWLHRRRRTSLRHFLRSEVNNRLLAIIRRFLADRVVYQSHFVHDWWEDWYGATRIPWTVIYNAVDVSVYTPDGPQERPTDRFRMMLVEGSLTGGQDVGLENALRLAEMLQCKHGFPMEVFVAAKVTAAQQKIWLGRSRVPLTFLGVVAREQIPFLDRSAHLFFSAEPNPPCPNSVIEALACGLPVIGFETGALPELVQGDAGRLVPYGGDPWKLDPPDIPSLAQATLEVLHDQARFRAAARRHAEQRFNLDSMVEAYLNVLLG